MSALGIETPAAAEKLLSLFIAGRDENGKSRKPVNPLLLLTLLELIPRHEALYALKTFVNENQIKIKEGTERHNAGDSDSLHGSAHNDRRREETETRNN